MPLKKKLPLLTIITLLGITLYELITKEVPFRGTESEIIKAHHFKKQPQIKANLSKKLKILVYGLLEKNYKKRWGKMR